MFREGNEGVKEITVSGDYTFFRLPANLVRVPLKNLGDAHMPKHFIGNRIEPERIFCMAVAPDSNVWYSTLKNVFRVNDILLECILI